MDQFLPLTWTKTTRSNGPLQLDKTQAVRTRRTTHVADAWYPSADGTGTTGLRRTNPTAFSTLPFSLSEYGLRNLASNPYCAQNRWNITVCVTVPSALRCPTPVALSNTTTRGAIPTRANTSPSPWHTHPDVSPGNAATYRRVEEPELENAVMREVVEARRKRPGRRPAAPVEQGEGAAGFRQPRRPRFHGWDTEREMARGHHPGSRPGTGRACLSPPVDCHDNGIVAYTAGSGPNAGLADRMLVKAVETLPEGAHPLVRSDRGCHCRWPGWLDLMDRYTVDGRQRAVPRTTPPRRGSSDS